MTAAKRNLSSPILARRAIAHGTGRLEGVTKVAGAPDTPVRRRVHLYQEGDHISGQLRRGFLQWIAGQWSEDGAWRFDDLDLASRYTVASYDHTGAYDPVLKGGLVPSPIVEDS